MNLPQQEYDFNEVFREYSPFVFRIALGMSGNYTDAEDISQETFTIIFKSLAKFRGESKLSSWIYRITIRVGTKWLVKKNRSPNESFQGNNPDISQSIDLIKAIQKLTYAKRLSVVLVLIQGLSHAEAGEILNVPEGTIASRIHSARKDLLELLKS